MSEQIPYQNEAADTIKAVYAAIAGEYDDRIPGTTPNDRRFTETEVSSILSRINRDDSVLDLGCGTGRFTIPIAKQARRVIGLDLSSAMLAQAQTAATKLDVKNIEWQEADMAAMPFQDASFDVVVCFLALMHVPAANTPRVFFEASRVLKPGGRMIVSVKNSLFERLTGVDRFASIDITDHEKKELVFTHTKAGKELRAPWHSYSPQQLAELYALAGMVMVRLTGNTPLSAWLADSLLSDPKIYGVVKLFESLFGDIPPFNHLGYHIIAEGVKPEEISSTATCAG